MPDYYDQRFEKTLQGQAIIEYHKHLISLGWVKNTSPAGYTNWKK